MSGGEQQMLTIARTLMGNPALVLLCTSSPRTSRPSTTARPPRAPRSPGALNETDYGSREFSALDPEGNVWSFGTYQPWAS